MVPCRCPSSSTCDWKATSEGLHYVTSKCLFTTHSRLSGDGEEKNQRKSHRNNDAKLRSMQDCNEWSYNFATLLHWEPRTITPSISVAISAASIVRKSRLSFSHRSLAPRKSMRPATAMTIMAPKTQDGR